MAHRVGGIEVVVDVVDAGRRGRAGARAPEQVHVAERRCLGPRRRCRQRVGDRDPDAGTGDDPGRVAGPGGGGAAGVVGHERHLVVGVEGRRRGRVRRWRPDRSRRGSSGPVVPVPLRSLVEELDVALVDLHRHLVPRRGARCPSGRPRCRPAPRRQVGHLGAGEHARGRGRGARAPSLPASPLQPARARRRRARRPAKPAARRRWRCVISRGSARGPASTGGPVGRSVAWSIPQQNCSP